MIKTKIILAGLLTLAAAFVPLVFVVVVRISVAEIEDNHSLAAISNTPSALVRTTNGYHYPSIK